jgi:hypothetical protein
LKVTGLDIISQLRWIDGRPFRPMIEPYRWRIYQAAFEREPGGRLKSNLGLDGRAKKNWKSADLTMQSLGALMESAPSGNECYLFANDEDQAGDNLSLAKKIIAANPALAKVLVIRDKVIHRKDGRGFLKILPAQDIQGTHGKTYRRASFDEIHGYRNWDLFEAMQLDPTRPDAQMWITSYASIYHKPGTPLFDLMLQGKAGLDPRMFFSWYAADYTTDEDFKACDPETRANPSRGTWADPNYLEQQRRRLPAHKFRRLHLNLPGLPEGSAFQPEPVMGAIERGVTVRPPEPGIDYVAFVDMSGGSNDDAVLAIGHQDAEERAVLDRVLNQGQPPPFDPHAAVERFAKALKEYRIGRVSGDPFAGETFRADFQGYGVTYMVSDMTRSQLYESMEPSLNGHHVVLLDQPEVEQQLLGLVWRGGKIDHPPGNHDDWANAVAGVVCLCKGDDEPAWISFLKKRESDKALITPSTTLEKEGVAQ